MDEKKKRLYEIIEVSQGKDRTSKSYDLLMLVSVIVGLIPLTMKKTNGYAQSIDIVTAIIFLFDYVMRFYTADYKMGVKSYKAYIAHVFTPMSIIDLMAIIPVFTLFFPKSNAIGLFRIFKVFRVLKLLRYSKTMVIIENVMRKVKQQLIAVLVLTLMYITASAMFIFQIEPNLFNNFFDALYWATISITTIGYGDISPVTVPGRMLTMISALVGVAVIALPSGIITAAYMDEANRTKTRFQK
ncbi:ion transporter [Lachnobacterium bovis]|uniref:ion transporter n=1 Tax=Lachnobacterium bovis TaxID=140626 RepID=UPI0003B3840B|nr:ion transporter [Lachnobacterium bovis]